MNLIRRRRRKKRLQKQGLVRPQLEIHQAIETSQIHLPVKSEQLPRKKFSDRDAVHLGRPTFGGIACPFWVRIVIIGDSLVPSWLLCGQRSLSGDGFVSYVVRSGRGNVSFSIKALDQTPGVYLSCLCWFLDRAGSSFCG